MSDKRPAGWPAGEVISAAQEGDSVAIEVLITGSHQHLRRFAHTLCATPEDAEDATQEALIILYRKIGTLRATAALASWMFQIVRNECIRRSRLALRRPAPTGLFGPSAEDESLARLEKGGSSTPSQGSLLSSAPSSSCVTSRASPVRPRLRPWASVAPR